MNSTSSNTSDLDHSNFGMSCPVCRYSLAGLPNQGNCPECDTPFNQSDLKASLYLKRWTPNLVYLGVAPAVAAVAILPLVFFRTAIGFQIVVQLCGLIPALLLSTIVVAIELPVALQGLPPGIPKPRPAVRIAAILLLIANCLMSGFLLLMISSCITGTYLF